MTQPTAPRKALLLLSLLVLGLHLAWLQSMPIHLSSTATSATVTFATRTLAPDVPAPTAPAAPVKPRPKRATKVQPAAPEPAPMPEPAPAPEPELAPVPQTQPPAASDQQLPPSPAELAEASAPAAEPLPAASTAARAAADAVAEASAAAAQPQQREPSASFNVQGVPGSVKLIYKVEANKFPYSLNAELVWQQDTQHYFASLQVGAFGQYRIQTSRGAFGTRGLLPERFSDKYRSEVAAHFNWPQHKVTFSANTPEVTLQEGAQDRMSILIQLAALVASAPERYTPGTRLTLQTVGPRDAAVWLFTVGEPEDLVVPSDPAGTVQTIKMTRQPQQRYDQQMELWLAPALGYLPARIRLQEANGDFLDQRWFATAAVDPL